MIKRCFSPFILLRLSLHFLFISPCSVLQAQPPLFNKILYVETYANEAQEQMLQFRIPASVILAQAILESGSGTSELARMSNNHFGIKCHREWGGDFVRKDDDSSNECFRSYASIRESYLDHSMFLFSRARYSVLFELSISDYKGWCYGLKACGYATAPKYAEDLIRLIEDLELYKFDLPENLSRQESITPEEQQLKTSPFNASAGRLDYFARCGLLFGDELQPHSQTINNLVHPPHLAEVLASE